jgi:hypothetical protein
VYGRQPIYAALYPYLLLISEKSFPVHNVAQVPPADIRFTFASSSGTTTNVSVLGTHLACYGARDNDQCLGVVYILTVGVTYSAVQF